jgi:hypothetical protein
MEGGVLNLKISFVSWHLLLSNNTNFHNLSGFKSFNCYNTVFHQIFNIRGSKNRLYDLRRLNFHFFKSLIKHSRITLNNLISVCKF